VLIKWLLYSAFVMLVTFLLLIMDIRLKYFKKLSLMETDINISDVFCNLYLVTNDSKLKHFQYKLLHRTLPTNTFLVKIGIKNSDLCNICINDTDSILHYIWLCPVVKLFWNRLKTWLEETFVTIYSNGYNIL
jgi:hypothetical protein